MSRFRAWMRSPGEASPIYLTKLTREKGLAVFFSSHDLEMVQRVADKIVRIDKGKIWLEKERHVFVS